MNIIEQGRRFVQRLRGLASRSAKKWRECPHCGSTVTCKNGWYVRHPWFLGGQEEVRVQRNECHACSRTYSEMSPLLVRGSWYAREVHRFTTDGSTELAEVHWQHVRSSLRRTAELVRSLPEVHLGGFDSLLFI